MKKMFKQRPVDITNAKDMFNWLKDHPTYHGDFGRELGFNVKIYNLCLTGNEDYVYNYIFNTDCYEINSMLEDFEEDHKGYVVGFEGRQCGHLTINNAREYRHEINEVLRFEDYDELKDWVKTYWGTMAEYKKYVLRPLVETVRDFDNMVDEIRDFMNEISLGLYEEEF